MKRHQIILILSVVIGGCGKKERGNNISTHAASFEKLDSVEVPFCGKFTVHDLDPLHEIILFVSEEQQPNIVVADFDGQIRASFSSKEVLPDGNGSLLAPLKIDGEDSFLAYATNGFLTYDFSGNLQSSIRHANGPVQGGQKSAMGEGMEKLGNKNLFINHGSGNIDKNGKHLTRELRLLTWLYPETGESESFVQFPKSSIFQQGGSFFRDAWKPAFTIANDLIYIVFGIEPVIYVYETSPPYSQISTIPMNLPEYNYTNRSDSHSSRLNYFEMPFTSGKTLNIKWFEGYFIIAYFPGFDLRESKEYADSKSTQELVNLSREMRRKSPIRMAVVDTLGNLAADFIPKNLEPKSMLLRNGELWMLEKPDLEVEQDYFRLFRVGLKIDR